MKLLSFCKITDFMRKWGLIYDSNHKHMQDRHQTHVHDTLSAFAEIVNSRGKYTQKINKNFKI